MTLKKADFPRFKKRLEEMKLQMTHLVRGTADEVKSTEESKRIFAASG